MTSPHGNRLPLPQQERVPRPATPQAGNSFRAGKPLRVLRAAMSAAIGVTIGLALTGCKGFFVPPGSTSTGTGTGTGSSGTDYAYVGNSSSGSSYLNGYLLSSGALTATTSSPYNLNYTPTAVAVTPSGSFVYIAADSAVSTAGVYGYSVGTGGALTILNSGTALSTQPEESLAISPDGNWLFALNSAQTLDEYTIDTSTGGLTLSNSFELSGASGGVITPYTIEVSPTGDYVACALGTGGVEIFSLDESTGALGTANLISPSSSSIGIFALAIDGSDYLYAAGTAGLQVFSVTTAGTPPALSPYPIGSSPRSVALSTNYNYVYVANQGSSTISAFSTASGVLTALAGSPFAAPTSVGAIGADSTGNYLLAEGYGGTSGIELYTIGTAGALTQSGEAASANATANPVIPVALGLAP